MSAARGAKEASDSRPTPLVDPWMAKCVSLAPAELKTTKLGPLWKVAFYTDETHGADVMIDYFGLQVITVMMIVDLRVPCAPKAPAIGDRR